MAEQEKEKELCQWHPAFYAGLQVEFGNEAEKLIFENEHQLGTKPKEIDVLIIRKNLNHPIRKNIGRIFRKHNIVEYKSPEDYLSIDDFYKVYAYACFYKADTPRVDEIKLGEITLTFVCSKYPYKLVRYLQDELQLCMQKQEEGIYYICGDRFPMQLIVISRLSRKKNFWLSNLTNHINDSERVSEVVAEYKVHQGNRLYQSVMDMIVRANKTSFEEVKGMCEALRELFKDELEEATQQVAERVTKEVTEEVTQQVTQRVTQQVTQQVKQQGIRQSIQSLMKNLKMSAEQAMEILEVPLEERKMYLV